MVTFWEPPITELATFKQWKNHTLRGIYQEAFTTPAAVLPNPITAAMSIGTLEGIQNMLQNVATTAITSYTSATTAARNQQEEKESKSPWTTLIKEKIIRCHGLRAMD